MYHTKLYRTVLKHTVPLPAVDEMVGCCYHEPCVPFAAGDADRLARGADAVGLDPVQSEVVTAAAAAVGVGEEG